jgi:hypothetical protein
MGSDLVVTNPEDEKRSQAGALSRQGAGTGLPSARRSRLQGQIRPATKLGPIWALSRTERSQKSDMPGRYVSRSRFVLHCTEPDVFADDSQVRLVRLVARHQLTDDAPERRRVVGLAQVCQFVDEDVVNEARR